MHAATEQTRAFLQREGSAAWNKLVEKVALRLRRHATDFYPPNFSIIPGGALYTPTTAFINYSIVNAAMGTPDRRQKGTGYAYKHILFDDLCHESVHHLQHLLGWEEDRYTDAQEGLAEFCTFNVMATDGMRNYAEIVGNRFLATAELRKIKGRSRVALPFGIKHERAEPMRYMRLRYVRGFLMACRVYGELGDDGVEKMFLTPFENLEEFDQYVSRLWQAQET